MKKHKKGTKLSRGQAARKALSRSLVRALVEHGSIETTQTKAKELERTIAKLVKLAKDGSVNSRRAAYSALGNDRRTTEGLFKLAKNNFDNRVSGFTRIVKLPVRRGDGSRLVRIEWVKNKDTKTAKGENKADELKKKGRHKKETKIRK